MDRKSFIKKSLLGTGAVAIAAAGIGKTAENQPETIGFNHIQLTPSNIMGNTICTKPTRAAWPITAGCGRTTPSVLHITTTPNA
jgi:hypothetical protein